MPKISGHAKAAATTLRWIFPVAVVILVGFIAFMGYRLTHHWSVWLFGFALFDVLTLALVINEWRSPRTA